MAKAMPPSGEVLLETERLQLRRWRVADAVIQRRLWAERDPRVPPHRRISADGRPTVTDLEERIRQDDRDGPSDLLAAVRKDSGEVIGYCGLIPNSHGQDGEPELAYEFLRAQWGQGLATEAARAVVDWAASRGYTRVWATVWEWNSASQRVLAKIGFVGTSRVEPGAEHGASRFYVKDLQPARHPERAERLR